MSLTGSAYQDFRYYLRHGNMVIKLIIINLFVFFSLKLMFVVGFLAQNDAWYHQLISALQIPAVPSQVIYKPWSLITYMFVHEGFLHILFNMLWLFWFGQIFMLYLGDSKILPLYIFGGLAGALFFVAAYNLFPVFAAQKNAALMMGASASAMALVFGAVAINPDHQVGLILFGLVRIKYLALFTLLLDIISIPTGNAGGHLAHIGGAAAGFLYIKLLQSGYDILSLPRIGKPGRKPKLSDMRVSRNDAYVRMQPAEPASGKSVRRSAPKQDPSAAGNSDQERLDEILDKISQSGYDSLSREEKEFLFKFSNNS